MERTIPKQLILIISLLQGFLLLALYKAVEHQVWPHGDSVSLIISYSLSIILPLMAMLALWSDNHRDLVKWLLVFGGGVTLVAAYIGYQMKPEGLLNTGAMITSFAITIGIASFKALMYVQQCSRNEKISYSSLFLLSWRNFLVLGLAVIFVGIFWGILMLWAALFKIIGINFFNEIFTNAWFYFPALSVAGGVAIIIFRNMSTVLDVIAKLLQALIKYLLPLIILVALLFLAALMFNGLDLLWKTRSGSILVLWLLAIVLFFVNTVYQDKSNVIPYSLIVHRFIYAGIAILPIYCLIAGYGLYLRIAQYGWTIGRGWGTLICILLAMFSIGYVWGIVKNRDGWINTLSTVNVTMSVVVMVLMLLLNSPLLDFRMISVKSQMGRLEEGKIQLGNLDISYFRNNLARPGYLAMQELKTRIKHSNPKITTDIDNAYIRRADAVRNIDAVTLKKLIITSPKAMKIPSSLLDVLLATVNKRRSHGLRNKHYFLVKKDMDGDGVSEYIWIEDSRRWGNATLWYTTSQGWKSLRMNHTGRWRDARFKQWIENNDLAVLPQKWKQLRFGDLIFSAKPE